MQIQDLSHLANQQPTEITEDQLRITSLGYATRGASTISNDFGDKAFISRATAIYDFLKNGPKLATVDTASEQQ